MVTETTFLNSDPVMSQFCDGDSFEFPFSLQRSSDETVGLHHKPVYHTDGSFSGFEVTSVL